MIKTGMAAGETWHHKLSVKMAAVTLALPVPALLLGSALFDLSPKPYSFLHHAGTKRENAEWLAQHGGLPDFLAGAMRQGWDAPLHGTGPANAAEARKLDIPESQLEGLEAAFARHNTGGAVGVSDLPAALREIGALTEAGHDDVMATLELQQQMHELIRHYDENENGLLDMPEFLNMAATRQKDVQGLRAAFDAFDDDADGRISFLPLGPGATSELTRAAEVLGDARQASSLHETASAADTDHDGRLDRHEFAKMILRGASHPCIAISYTDREALSSSILTAPLVAGVLVSAMVIVGGSLPRNMPALLLGVGATYLLATLAQPALLRRGLPAALVSFVGWGVTVMPAGFFCSRLFRHGGLAHTGAFAVAVIWLAAMAQVVDWAYRHFFRALLSSSMAGGVVAIVLAVVLPATLNMLTSVVLAREWSRVSPVLPFERSRPLYLFAYLTVARAQREMLADVYLSPSSSMLAFPAVLAIAGARYYNARTAAMLVDKGSTTIPVAATKAIASGWAELWAVGAVVAAHLVSAGSCRARHHSWGTVSGGYLAFAALQLLVELGVSVAANGMLLREGVRVDRAQRALRPMDHLADILIGGFATAMCVAEGDRCAALLAGVCGGFRQRVSGG